MTDPERDSLLQATSLAVLALLVKTNNKIPSALVPTIRTQYSEIVLRQVLTELGILELTNAS
jgi:hypothetical protein